MPKDKWKHKRQKEPIKGSKRGPKPLPGPLKETPKSSARPIGEMARKNLTLLDWMTVYAYVDTLPQPIKQVDVVKYFATRPEGPLIFTQSTLSCKLQHRSEMEACMYSNPNALSSKRPRIITRPEVDRALWLWVQHMEQKQEVVNTGMLVAKRAAFEEAFGVPEDERLTGPGWVQSFCRAHQLKEIRRHGEAGSVNTETVKEERTRIREPLARFRPGDHWNIDESALFALPPPDRGLSQRPFDDEPEAVPPPLKEVIKMCRILEEHSMVVCSTGAFKFVKALREYRGHLQEMSRGGEKQTTLDTFLGL